MFSFITVSVYHRFYVMETCKDWYKGGDPNAKVPKLVVGLFGGFAGACSVLGARETSKPRKSHDASEADET